MLSNFYWYISSYTINKRMLMEKLEQSIDELKGQAP